jgi:hypothetical protein
MKLVLIALLIAVVLTSSAPIAFHLFGFAALGTWMMVVSFPGSIVAGWLWNHNVVSGAVYCAWTLVNWAFYYLLIQGALLLKRKISR